MTEEYFNMSEFDPCLPELVKQWRKDQGLRLQQAKKILGISIGYISDLENGKVKFSDRAFNAYHRQAPDIFPMALASKFPIMGLDVDGGASENNAALKTEEKKDTIMDPQAQAQEKVEEETDEIAKGVEGSSETISSGQDNNQDDTKEGADTIADGATYSDEKSADESSSAEEKTEDSDEAETGVDEAAPAEKVDTTLDEGVA